MASSFSENGVVRSISLPSRLHSNSPHFEAELNKLKSWEFSSSSSSSVQSGLVRLAELYNSMADAIQSPETQQALRRNKHAAVIEEALESSVMLLDTVGLARDTILTMREQLQDLQSVLRRRQCVDNNVNAYVSFRKKAKKDVIAKCLKSLKKMGNENDVVLSSRDQNLVAALKWAREVNCVAVAVLRSLMVVLSGPVTGKWSAVRRLVAKRGGSVGPEESVNEIVGLDCAMQRGSKKNGGIEQERLERVDASMKGLEDGLDLIFRSLIHNRVALLNVLAL